MEINFEKDEFNYHATTLVFGMNGSRIRDFSIYNIDAMRKYKDISFNEYSGINTESVMDVTRDLKISSSRIFQTSGCMRASGTSQKVTFLDSVNKINVSDKIFTDQEYDYFEKNWDTTVKNKVRTFGILIRSVYTGKIVEVPILINEFPNITAVLFNFPNLWVKQE